MRTKTGLTTWRRNFMAAIAATGRVTTVPPEDVATNADHALVNELRRASAELANYTARVEAALPTRLAVVKGGDR